MPNIRDLLPNLLSGRSRSKEAARREALVTRSRDNAFTAFQQLLRDNGYVDKTPRPGADGYEQPARDTQGNPSTNPLVGEASREGPAIKPVGKAD